MYSCVALPKLRTDMAWEASLNTSEAFDSLCCDAKLPLPLLLGEDGETGDEELLLLLVVGDGDDVFFGSVGFECSITNFCCCCCFCGGCCGALGATGA